MFLHRKQTEWHSVKIDTEPLRINDRKKKNSSDAHILFSFSFQDESDQDLKCRVLFSV